LPRAAVASSSAAASLIKLYRKMEEQRSEAWQPDEPGEVWQPRPGNQTKLVVCTNDTTRGLNVKDCQWNLAEPSLLCVNCFKPPPEGRAKWQSCVRCAKLKLPATYYCSEECQTAHWPKHMEYHTKQKAQMQRRGANLTEERSLVKQLSTGEFADNVYTQTFTQAIALMVEGNLNGAAKAFRKIIETWPGTPMEPTAYQYLGTTLHRSSRHVEALGCFIKVMDLSEEDTLEWAKAAVNACKMLMNAAWRDAHDEALQPEWWHDEGYMALSERVVAVAPDIPDACEVRAFALSGLLSGAPGVSWEAGPRTAAQIKEAAVWFRRADEPWHKELASSCDIRAGRMLAWEEAEAAAAEAEAATARAADEVEAAARKAAEEKANAAAEELLAEEEKEKQVAASASAKAGKVKQSKGKKGKGKGKR